DDLILPVYYVECPVLEDEDKRNADPVAQAIAAHQYADWREHRFAPLTSESAKREMAKLAIRIRDALAIESSSPKQNNGPDKGLDSGPTPSGRRSGIKAVLFVFLIVVLILSLSYVYVRLPHSPHTSPLALRVAVV